MKTIASTTNLNIRIDSNLKNRYQYIFNTMCKK